MKVQFSKIYFFNFSDALYPLEVQACSKCAIIIVSSFNSHRLFTDLPLTPDSPLLDDAADIDFGFDSGIEAEMDEPHGNVFISCLLFP